MNKKIILFNIVYYAVIIVLIMRGRDDPSSSLGYGYFISIYCAVTALILIYLLIRKIILPKSLLDKIGIFTATPILSIIGIAAIVSLKENVSSESYFNKNNYRYKIRTFNFKNSNSRNRIEYYRNADTIDLKG